MSSVWIKDSVLPLLVKQLGYGSVGTVRARAIIKSSNTIALDCWYSLFTPHVTCLGIMKEWYIVVGLCQTISSSMKHWHYPSTVCECYVKFMT